MEFKFDEKAFRKFHNIAIPICGFIALVVFAIHYKFGLNPVLFFVLFTPFAIYAGSKSRFITTEIKERHSERISIKSGKVSYVKESSGYTFDRDLKDILKVEHRKIFGAPTVVVQFTKNETFKFSWFKEPNKLYKALKSV